MPGRFDTLEMLTDRNAVQEAIFEALEARWADDGIIVEDVALQEIRYGEQVTGAYAAAQEAQINVQTETAKLEAAKVSAQQKVVQAQAEADANAILAASLTPAILQQRYLDTLKELAAAGNLVDRARGLQRPGQRREVAVTRSRSRAPRAPRRRWSAGSPGSAARRPRSRAASRPRRSRRPPRPSRETQSAGATGTARMTRSAPSARATRQATPAVAPVATPSSTTIAVRPGEVERRPSRPVALLAPDAARRPRRVSTLRDRVVARSDRRDRARVDDADPARPDRAHRELGMAGGAELADDQHVEGCAERVGDDPRDRDAAAGQAEHDRVVEVAELEDREREPARRRPRDRRTPQRPRSFSMSRRSRLVGRPAPGSRAAT